MTTSYRVLRDEGETSKITVCAGPVFDVMSAVKLLLQSRDETLYGEDGQRHDRYDEWEPMPDGTYLVVRELIVKRTAIPPGTVIGERVVQNGWIEERSTLLHARFWIEAQNQ